MMLDGVYNEKKSQISINDKNSIMEVYNSEMMQIFP